MINGEKCFILQGPTDAMMCNGSQDPIGTPGTQDPGVAKGNHGTLVSCKGINRLLDLVQRCLQESNEGTGTGNTGGRPTHLK